MTATEQANARRWGQAWKEAGPLLEQIRADEIRATDTRKSIAAFDGLFEAAVRDFPPSNTSGLVEQQHWFHSRRK